jgi:hypothetical protein
VKLNLKQVLLVPGLHRHFTEAQRTSFLFQAMPPIDDLFSRCAVIGSESTRQADAAGR